MQRKLNKTMAAAKVAASAAVIIIGAAYSARCLLGGQAFCAACFAAMAYLSGYRLLLKSSIEEYRKAKSL